jgi:ubiquinone/menaquinone biosynthesis C-methylase UbiE
MGKAGDLAMNDRVRGYWEKQPCGTEPVVVGDADRFSRAWFERVEEFRYQQEPFIHSVAQFTRHHGKKILEVGVGAGTDHLQWARAGAECHGVDLTDAAIETTRKRLGAFGFESQLTRVDAETLPFDDDSFDVVYSWGVIHHSAKPESIVAEIHRVLRPGGLFLGMMYNRHSYAALKWWVKYALLRCRPWRSLDDVMWHHMESVGTKTYTVSELRRMFGAFQDFHAEPIIINDERKPWPRWLSQFFPARWGFFIAIRATK